LSSDGPLRILGIDPGTIATGYGLIEERAGRLTLLDHGTIRAASSATLAQRVTRIFDGLERVLDESQPDEAAIEAVFHGKNARSALVLGHARGVALLALGRRGLVLGEYAPSEVKQALVGSGRAEKSQVESMVRALLRLATPIRSADAADAVAVAICHAHSRRLRSLDGAARAPRSWRRVTVVPSR